MALLSCTYHSQWLHQSNLVCLPTQIPDQTNGDTEEEPAKRPRDDSDYEAGSDYYHYVFGPPWVREHNVYDLNVVLQTNAAQGQAQEDWQLNHDRLFGPTKKSNAIHHSSGIGVDDLDALLQEVTTRARAQGNMVRESEERLSNSRKETNRGAPSPETINIPSGPTSAKPKPKPKPSPVHKDTDRRLRNADIDKRFKPVIERFRRIEAIKRQPPAPTAPGPDDERPGRVTFDTSLIAPKDGARDDKYAPHPALPRTDQDFEEAIVILKQMMRDWTREFFFDKLSAREKRDFNLYILAQRSPDLMDFAGWVAVGGSLESWMDNFVAWRSSLMFGILGKVLEVMVFGHTMFGATPYQLKTLETMDLALLHVEGIPSQHHPSAPHSYSNNPQKY